MSESNKGQNRLDFDLRTRIAAAALLSKPMLVLFAFCGGNLFQIWIQGLSR